MSSVKQTIVFVFGVLSGIMPVAAQEYRDYQSCEASITYLNRTENKNEKLAGTTITLTDYSRQLEVKSVLPVVDLSMRSDLGYEPFMAFDLKLFVAPNKMQRYLTSEKVFTAYGTLQLNHISRTVSVQYTPWPEGTEYMGQMNVSLLLSFNLSDFFPDAYADEPIALLINNGYVNRHQR
jgi:hypothetical protein